MNSSDNSAKTLGDIIDKKRFVIPMYQRNYKWNTSVAIKLVDDILDYYNCSKKENNPQISKSLGLLTLYKENEKYYVIDGQQRFTTLSILLSVLNTKAESNIDLEFERDKLVCKKRRKAITGECLDECTDVNRINRNKNAICNELNKYKVDAKEYGDIAKFVLEHVIMLCSIVNEQPVEEFMNLNAYKTAFSISDHIRANLISLNSFYKEEMSKGEYGPILARCLSKKTYKTAVAILYNNIQEKLYDVPQKDENGTYKSIYDLLKEPKEILDPDKEARINIIFRGMLDKEAQNYASGEITENFDYWIKMLQKLAYVNKLLDELKNELDSGEFHSFKQIDDYQKMTGKSFVLEVFDGICRLDENWNSQILAKEIQKYSNVDSVLIRCLNQNSKKLANRYLEAFVYSNINEETIKKADNESGEKIKLSQMAMDEVVDEISGCGRFVVDRYEREHREDLDTTITIPPVIDLEDRENVNFGGSFEDEEDEIEGGDLIKIGNLFKYDIKIPVIQRDYCMGARITGKNDFLDYLISGFEKNEKKEKKEKKESLIASTILISISKDGSIYIFDGQQRTFTLYNILKYCNAENIKSYSFIGRTEENANNTDNCGSPYSKQAVVNLNEILKDKIKENVDKDNFAKYIKENVKLKVKIVESVSGAEQFFMDINGGVALEKYEIFKAMLCNRLAALDGFDGLDVIRNIENEWLDFFYKYRRDYLGSSKIQNDESDIEELLEIRFIEFICRFVYQMNHWGAKYEDIYIKNGDGGFSKQDDSTYGKIIKDSTLSRPKSFDEIGSKGEMVTGLSYIDALDVQDFEMIRSVLNEITNIDNTSNDKIPGISLEKKKIDTNSTGGYVMICGLEQKGTKQEVLDNKGYYIKRFIWSLIDENRRLLKKYYRYENDESIIEKIYDHDQIMRDILLSILEKDIQGYVQEDVQGYVQGDVYPYQINEKKCNIIYCGYRHNEDHGDETWNVGKREVEYNCIKEIPAYYYNEIDKKINNDSQQIVRLRYLQDKSGQQKDNYKFALVKDKVKNQIEYEDKTNSNICLANNFSDNVECQNRTEAYCITYIDSYISQNKGD